VADPGGDAGAKFAILDEFFRLHAVQRNNGLHRTVAAGAHSLDRKIGREV
jgi:hypothetical protein